MIKLLGDPAKKANELLEAVPSHAKIEGVITEKKLRQVVAEFFALDDWERASTVGEVHEVTYPAEDVSVLKLGVGDWNSENLKNENCEDGKTRGEYPWESPQVIVDVEKAIVRVVKQPRSDATEESTGTLPPERAHGTSEGKNIPMMKKSHKKE